MAIGQVIREQRNRARMTLEEVAKRTGYSKPYLSTVETGRVKNPPSDDLLRKLEEVLDFEKGLLVQMAHLERLPADMREMIETNRAENAQLRELIRKVVEEKADVKELAKKHKQLGKASVVDNTRHVETAGRLVPVINKVSAGYPVDFDDKDYPPGAADEYVRCVDLHDPTAFAVTVVGDSMEPKYHEGDVIVFSPVAEVRNGDDCFVRMTDPHETTFKQVFFAEDGTVRLQPRNMQYPPLILPGERVNGLWRAVIRYERLQ